MDPVIGLSVGLLGVFVSAYLAGLRFAQANRSQVEENIQSEFDNPGGALERSEGRLQFIAQLMKPSDRQELNQLRRELSWAGMRRTESLELYNAVRGTLLFSVIGILLLLIVLGFLGGDSLFLISFILAAGFFGPKIWLRAKISERQEALNRSLPSALDLLVTCMEAGLNLEQAIDRVARELKETEPELADEFLMVLQELNAGLSLGAAFRKFSDRVTTDEIKNLCHAIIQASTLGASLGRTLREYSSSARRKRELRLEESAGKVTARITLPLTLCLLPSAMLAMMAPAVVSIVESLF